MFDTEDTKATTGLLDFLGGGTPPVFEEYGAEALRAGTVRAAAGSMGSRTSHRMPACTICRRLRAGGLGRRAPLRA